MKNKKLWMASIAVLSVAVLIGCTSATGTDENQDANGLTESRGEHEREGSEGEHAEDGEESGTELTLNERYDSVRNGARLILIYDAESNSFNGTVENTTDDTLQQVRVEVHLSNGIELGPTTRVDLAPGEMVNVTLAATDEAFDGWTAHPEVDTGSGEGSGEHGNGSEGGEGENDESAESGEHGEVGD